MLRSFFIGTMICIGLVSMSHAAGVEVAVGGWRQTLSGELSYQALDSTDLIDLEENLSLDDESRIFGRIKIDTPAFVPNFHLVGAPAEFEGTGSKSVAFTFGGTTYNANTELRTKIQAVQYDIGIFWGLPFIETATAGKFGLDVGLNVRIADLDVEITGTSGATTVTEQESVLLPVPMLYLAAKFAPIKSLAIEAEGRGLSVGGNTFYSVTGRLRYQFPGPLFIAGGYRFDKLDVDEDDLVVDIELKGPFVELGMSF